MRRRDFITLVGAAVGWPLASRAQRSPLSRRIVVLMGAAENSSSRGWLATFFHRLDSLEWHERSNLITKVQWWNDQPEQMQVWAAELIAGSPDVALTFTTRALEVMKPLAGNVPIVFLGVGDPVGGGFVSSFAHPSGNITGFASHDQSLGSKWLEVLKETAPDMRRVLVIMDPADTANQAMWRSIEEAAPRLGVEATAGGVHNAGEIEGTIKSSAQQPNGGLVILPNAFTVFNRSTIIALARQYRLPTSTRLPKASQQADCYRMVSTGMTNFVARPNMSTKSLEAPSPLTYLSKRRPNMCLRSISKLQRHLIFTFRPRCSLPLTK